MPSVKEGHLGSFTPDHCFCYELALRPHNPASFRKIMLRSTLSSHLCEGVFERTFSFVERSSLDFTSLQAEERHLGFAQVDQQQIRSNSAVLGDWLATCEYVKIKEVE